MMPLYQMAYQILAIARQHIDNRNLNHGVATRLLMHGSTSHVDQHLTCQSGVVDAHIELQTLVLGFSTHTLAHQMYTMTHVTHIVNALHLENVSLVVGEIGVGLDGGSHILQLSTILQLYIHHAAMDALTQGDSHRQSILHASLRAHTDAMAH